MNTLRTDPAALAQTENSSDTKGDSKTSTTGATQTSGLSETADTAREVAINIERRNKQAAASADEARNSQAMVAVANHAMKMQLASATDSAERSVAEMRAVAAQTQKAKQSGKTASAVSKAVAQSRAAAEARAKEEASR